MEWNNAGAGILEGEGAQTLNNGPGRSVAPALSLALIDRTNRPEFAPMPTGRSGILPARSPRPWLVTSARARVSPFPKVT